MCSDLLVCFVFFSLVHLLAFAFVSQFVCLFICLFVGLFACFLLLRFVLDIIIILLYDQHFNNCMQLHRMMKAISQQVNSIAVSFCIW